MDIASNPGLYEIMGLTFDVVRILEKILDELNIGEHDIKLNDRKLLDGFDVVLYSNFMRLKRSKEYGVKVKYSRNFCYHVDIYDLLRFYKRQKFSWK